MAPEVPSIVFSTTPVILSSNTAASVVGFESSKFLRIASAPRFSPIPQSPSPTIVS